MDEDSDSETGSSRNEKTSKSYKSKLCNFYGEDGSRSSQFKLAINATSFPNINSLKTELTRRMVTLPSGVRRIYTPRCITEIKSLDNLKNEGHYICTSSGKPRRNRFTKPLQGSARHSSKRKIDGGVEWDSTINKSDDSLLLRKASQPAWDSDGCRSGGRDVTVFLGDIHGKQISFTLDSKWTLQDVLKQASMQFHVAVRKLLTPAGEEVTSFLQLFDGLRTFVARTNEFIDTPRRDKSVSDKSTFKVKIKTGSLPSAGTRGRVFITIYGKYGNCGKVLLGSGDSKTFQCGATDEFNVQCGAIGKPFKVRLEHETMNHASGWFCDSVEVVSSAEPGKTFLFPSGRWLSYHDDDWQVFKELPLVVDGQKVLPVVTYEVFVKTGNVWNGGTKGKVYLVMNGENGDSGRRHLFLPTVGDVFSMGQLDVFPLEIVWLGNIDSLIVSCEGGWDGAGWFLDEIVVKCNAPVKMKWIFPCFRWFSATEDDGRTERELKLYDDNSDESFQCEMFKLQGWKFQDGNMIELYSTSYLHQINMVVGDNHSEPANIFKVHKKNGHSRIIHLEISGSFVCVKDDVLTTEVW